MVEEPATVTDNGYNFPMYFAKTDWYFILLALVAFALVAANEAGYGEVALLLGLLLEYWLSDESVGIPS